MNIRFRFPFWIMALALTSVSPNSALAEDGPSYNDTVSFLQEKLNTRSRDGSDSEKFEEVSRCKFRIYSTTYTNTLHFQNINPPDNIKWSATVIEFSARDLDPSRVAVNFETEVQFFTLENYKLIRKRSIFYDVPSAILEGYGKQGDFIECDLGMCHRDVYYRSAAELDSILSPANENAPRVRRAMEHLIRLCGGKEELF